MIRFLYLSLVTFFSVLTKHWTRSNSREVRFILAQGLRGKRRKLAGHLASFLRK